MALNIVEKQDAYTSPKIDFVLTVNPSLNDIRDMADNAPNHRVRTGTRILGENVAKQFPKAAEFADMPISVANLRTPLTAVGLRLEPRKRCCS